MRSLAHCKQTYSLLLKYPGKIGNTYPNDTLCREPLPSPSTMHGLRGKEPLDNSCRVFRVFFREEVTTFHCLSMHVRGPLPPNAERTAVFCIEGVERATLGPEMQHRACDSPGCFLVSTIVFDIDRGCGSIFLTDAMNAGRITIGGQ